MSSTVEVYLRHPGEYPVDELAAVTRVASALDVRGYFGSSMESFRFTLEPGVGGLLSVDLTRVEGGLGTAFSPFDFQLSMELLDAPALARGELRERAGREVFDRLTVLDVPLAFADGTDIFADFLPGRGVREFPPGTSWEEDGRDVWFDPRLHATGKPVYPDVPHFPQGSVRVFETNGLIQFVPWSGDGALPPVASLRAGAGPVALGRALAETLERSGRPVPATADPWSWVTGTARSTPGGYARAAVSIDIEVQDALISALPHDSLATATGDRVEQGPAVESLAVRRFVPWDDKRMGDLVLTLIEQIRARVTF